MNVTGPNGGSVQGDPMARMPLALGRCVRFDALRPPQEGLHLTSLVSTGSSHHLASTRWLWVCVSPMSVPLPLTLVLTCPFTLSSHASVWSIAIWAPPSRPHRSGFCSALPAGRGQIYASPSGCFLPDAAQPRCSQSGSYILSTDVSGQLLEHRQYARAILHAKRSFDRCHAWDRCWICVRPLPCSCQRAAAVSPARQRSWITSLLLRLSAAATGSGQRRLWHIRRRLTFC